MTKFIVVGQGLFPLDMLAVERCYPNSGVDAWRITDDKRRAITLVHVGDADWKPDYRQWKELGWVAADVGSDAWIAWKGRAHE